MQDPIAPMIDRHYVDAMIREARRQRSEYICGLISSGWSALRRRLASAKRAGTGHSYPGTPRTA